MIKYVLKKIIIWKQRLHQRTESVKCSLSIMGKGSPISLWHSGLNQQDVLDGHESEYDQDMP